MASLANDPMGWELEDFVAAHFISRGCYVETGIKERNPDDILELDAVWTDYRVPSPIGHPVEVKSGDWGLGDVFKFYGWTRYLGLEPGQFIHKEPCGRLAPKSLNHVSTRTGIAFLHVPKPEDAEGKFKQIGLPDPHWSALPSLWRYSFWVQRRLLKSLGVAIDKGVCARTAKAAKEYHQLINDAVFFIPDVRERVGELLTAHFGHQNLGASVAYEQPPPLTAQGGTHRMGNSSMNVVRYNRALPDDSGPSRADLGSALWRLWGEFGVIPRPDSSGPRDLHFGKGHADSSFRQKGRNSE